jgi:hypothetical protein
MLHYLQLAEDSYTQPMEADWARMDRVSGALLDERPDARAAQEGAVMRKLK